MNAEKNQLATTEDSSALVHASPQAEGALPVVLMPKHVAAVVPFKDYERWDRLSLKQQTRVSQLLEVFAEIEAAPEGINAASNRLGLSIGISAVSLHRLRGNFKREGWTALAKIYKGPQALPDEFVTYVRGQVLRNKRVSKTALQEIRDKWAAGEPVPGYGTWRDWFALEYPERDLPTTFPGVYPKGWSFSNLYDKQPTRPQRKAAREGFASARRFLPSVVRDTSKLRPLELITIDDFELDFLVRAFNPVRRRWEICRCAGLLAIDVATRCKLAVALVPRFKLTRKECAMADTAIAANSVLDEDAGEAETAKEKKTRISITRRDVQLLIHEVFRAHGRPADYGCTILCENASAAITYDLELQLGALLQVQVSRTGLIDEKTLKNGFVQGGGKPWEKGWIEALFNLVWNRAGALPGQKGSSYEKRPADHEAAVAYAMKLLDRVPAAEADRFKFPFLTIDQALDGLNAIFERIERREDHRMIGFNEEFRYRLPDGSAEVDERSLALMAPGELVRCEPIPYRQSPRARWEMLMAGKPLAQVPAHILALMLLQPKACELKDHKITFTLPGRGGFTFADAESEVMKLPDGSKLLGYIDPTAPHVLYVTDEKGEYKGAVRRRGMPIDIRDQVAISNEAGAIAHLVRACVTAENRKYLAGDNQALAEMDAHNLALQEQLGVAKPVRISPEKKLLPDAAANHTAPGHNGQSPAEPLALATRTTGATAPQRPATLSTKLANPLARDAFGTFQKALAQGIAEQVGKADARVAMEKQTRADAEHLSDDDIEAATGRRPVAAEPTQEFSAEEISDLLRDPKK